jgi:acyl-CoA synthetase (AMP-forming)/AMP-acid ligase II
VVESRVEYRKAIGFLTGEGQQFETEYCVINGVNSLVYKNSPKNLKEYFELTAGNSDNSDKTFIVFENRRYTYAEIMQLARQFAASLLSDYFVAKGDRVAIAMRNNPEWIVAYMGALLVGAVVVPMNAWWTGDELKYGLEDSDAKVVVCDLQRATRILPYADEMELSLVVVADQELTEETVRFDDLLAVHFDASIPSILVDPEDDATIMYTSGSTGHPKGAVSTHRAVLSAIMSWCLMGSARELAENQKSAETPYPPAALLTVPLFHVTGSHSLFLQSMLVGQKLVIMTRWDAKVAAQLIERERITFFNGVPTMSAELQVVVDSGQYDVSSISNISSGGAARPPEQVKKIIETFGYSLATTGYGLTETNALGCVIWGEDYEQRSRSVGRVVPAVTEIKVIDSTGRSLDAGEAGEICVKTPANVRGYWNSPEATSEAFIDGWFHTGDVGYLDKEGFLFIVDRIKDIIIRGGENISCLEVEAAIYEHPSVEEAVVFGMPDERLGEVVGAVVVLRPEKQLARESLEDFLAKTLAAFKVPAHIWFQQKKLPRIASGKISKRDVKEKYLVSLV